MPWRRSLPVQIPKTYLDLHAQTGVRFSWGLVSGGSDLNKLIETSRPLAKAGALLAFEGNNEPNNWGVTYQGEKGGGRAPSWLAVAKLQRDLYKTVKDASSLHSWTLPIDTWIDPQDLETLAVTMRDLQGLNAGEEAS